MNKHQRNKNRRTAAKLKDWCAHCDWVTNLYKPKTLEDQLKFIRPIAINRHSKIAFNRMLYFINVIIDGGIYNITNYKLVNNVVYITHDEINYKKFSECELISKF